MIGKKWVISKKEIDMEGWLYIIRSNRFGLQFSRKRYFILHNNVLNSYKAIPISDKEEPVRSALIHKHVRVIDNGRESINKKVFFIFTLYTFSDNNDQLKLGTSSSEEAARWICCLKDAALKGSSSQAKNCVASLGVGGTKKTHGKIPVRWSSWASIHAEEMTSDVIAPSPWKIFGCRNGLRLFKEAKFGDSHGGHWDDHPAIMAAGVVDGTSEYVFHALMSLGPSRSEWDFCLHHGCVVEHVDGHTDIIYKKLSTDWLPWGMKRRDLLLQRYWRREDDGTYVILYHSVIHKKCPPQPGYVRVCLKSGGYIITPVNQEKQSLIKHMLAIDWKFWKLHLHPSASRSLTIRMLERVAALRELFKAIQGNYSHECLFREWLSDTHSPQIEKEDTLEENEVEKPPSGRVNLLGLNEAPDEFFDVPDASEFAEYNHFESECCIESNSELCPPNIHRPKLTSATGLVRKLQDIAIQKKGYMDLQEVAREDSQIYSYGTSLQEDPTSTLPCSWSVADPSSFLIRGKNYLKDKQKIKANGTLMQMVGADWLISDKREDDLGSRHGGLVQKYAVRGGPEFFFILNFQIPGSPRYTIAMYYMIKTPLEDHPLLYNFVNGDDAFRNSRFKFISYVSKGSWIVKQSVGRKPCLLGQALEAHYFRGKNYLEVEIDVGSSTVARGVANLVFGYINKLVLEMAIVIQGNTQEELPEILLGTCQLNHLDLSKALIAPP